MRRQAHDPQTEYKVMDSILRAYSDVTFIVIAHRLTTIQRCDHVYFVEEGSIKHSGTFEEVLKTAFMQAMAKANDLKYKGTDPFQIIAIFGISSIKPSA